MSRSIFLTLLGLTVGVPVKGTEPLAAERERASELLRRQRCAEAGMLEHLIARNLGVSQAAAEACFREADRLRQQHLYPPAALLYRRSIELGGAKELREQAFRHLYDIASYWLDDTRAQIRRDRQLREQWPDLWWVPPPLAEFFDSAQPRVLALLNLLHWDPTKPFFNEEGRALELLLDLEARGAPEPGADKALFLAGSVHFHREAYGEAEGPLTRLVQ